MRRIMLLPSLFLAAPGASQTPGENIVATPFDLARAPSQTPLTQSEPIIVTQFVERFEPDGAKVRQRGILVGKDIGRNMTVGIGLVDRRTRKSGLAPGLDESPRRSGKASMLLRYKF